MSFPCHNVSCTGCIEAMGKRTHGTHRQVTGIQRTGMMENELALGWSTRPPFGPKKCKTSKADKKSNRGSSRNHRFQDLSLRSFFAFLVSKISLIIAHFLFFFLGELWFRERERERDWLFVCVGGRKSRERERESSGGN